MLEPAPLRAPQIGVPSTNTSRGDVHLRWSGQKCRFASLGQLFCRQVAIWKVGVRESKLLDEFFFQFLQFGGRRADERRSLM